MKITYQGLADVREITRSQLKDAGVLVDFDIVLSRFAPRNSMTVEVSPELEALLNEQGGFRLDSVTDSGDEKLVHRAGEENLGDHTVVDTKTGNVSIGPRAQA